MKKISGIISFVFFLFALLSLSPHQTYAASTTISLTPQNGSYATPFTVSLVIDGHGDIFNAAQSIVALSSNLSVSNLTLGDCNFSFLTTPSTINPSFAGVLLGSSLKKCTMYTMNLTPISKGNGTVTLLKSSVKRFGDAVEILSEATGGKYTLTGSSPVQPLPTIAPSQGGLYSVLLTIRTSDTKPAVNTTVTLQPVAKGQTIITRTDSNGNAQLSNISSGVYTVTAEDNMQKNTTILNISGRNHTIVLGVMLQNKPAASLTISMRLVWKIILGFVIVIILLSGVLLWKRKKKS